MLSASSCVHACHSMSSTHGQSGKGARDEDTREPPSNFDPLTATPTPSCAQVRDVFLVVCASLAGAQLAYLPVAAFLLSNPQPLADLVEVFYILAGEAPRVEATPPASRTSTTIDNSTSKSSNTIAAFTVVFLVLFSLFHQANLWRYLSKAQAAQISRLKRCTQHSCSWFARGRCDGRSFEQLHDELDAEAVPPTGAREPVDSEDPLGAMAHRVCGSGVPPPASARHASPSPAVVRALELTRCCFVSRSSCAPSPLAAAPHNSPASQNVMLGAASHASAAAQGLYEVWHANKACDGVADLPIQCPMPQHLRTWTTDRPRAWWETPAVIARSPTPAPRVHANADASRGAKGELLTRLCSLGSSYADTFGFQEAVVSDQCKHLVSLIASRASRLDSVAATAARAVHKDLFEPYLAWCEHVGAAPRCSQPGLIANTKSPEWIVEDLPPIESEACEAEALLYLLVWAESANLRHAPEAVWWIYHELSKASRLQRPFLEAVVRPLYDAAVQLMHDRKPALNYDDINEAFWRPRCLAWTLEGAAAGSAAAELLRLRKTYRERRSWLHALGAFERVYFAHWLMLRAVVTAALGANTCVAAEFGATCNAESAIDTGTRILQLEATCIIDIQVRE